MDLLQIVKFYLLVSFKQFHTSNKVNKFFQLVNLLKNFQNGACFFAGWVGEGSRV